MGFGPEEERLRSLYSTSGERYFMTSVMQELMKCLEVIKVFLLLLLLRGPSVLLSQRPFLPSGHTLPPLLFSLLLSIHLLFLLLSSHHF